MERNYLRSDALVELDFITERYRAFHYHENIELLFVISGKMVMTIEGNAYPMNTGDMIAVNANRKHSYNGSRDLVLGRFLISYAKVSELLGQNQVVFLCYSGEEFNEEHRDLRRIIEKIFNQVICSNDKSKLYLNSLYYRMVHILVKSFSVKNSDLRFNAKSQKKDERIEEIFSYIRMNYYHNITLDDIAQHLHLSPTYISKYIKQRCEINFIELLNTVRLNRSMADLMYSQDSVTKIAMENGFASVTSYNKIFKNTHHMTPFEFRRLHRQKG